MHDFLSTNALRASADHQLRMSPSASKCEPWSSKPCVISCPMTAPIAP